MNGSGRSSWFSSFALSWLSSGILLSGFSAAMAGSAPKELYNKSIDIFWGENTSNKRVADGVVVNSAGRIERIVYISRDRKSVV